MATLIANGEGRIVGKFSVPAGVPAGRKEVSILGSQGNRGATLFVGDGVINTQTLQRIITSLVTRYDPVAQTFTLPIAEQVRAVDVFVVTKGVKPIRVQIRETGFGVPSQVVLAEAVLTAVNLTANSWQRFVFPIPVSLSPNVEYAIVVLSDEATPSVGVAELGKYDAAAQRWVSSQPYQVGVMLSSSNASTWTPHQDRDLAFRIIGQRYNEFARTVELGSVYVANCTEFRLQGLIESPVQGASGSYELEFPDGSKRDLGNGQLISLASPVTGNVKVRARLTATAAHSAVLYPGTTLAAGTITSTAEYVTRAVDADPAGADVRVVFDAIIPSGAVVTVWQKGLDAGDAWVAVPVDQPAVPLGDNLYEYSFAANNVMEARLRFKLVLSGTPAARPRVRNLRITVL